MFDACMATFIKVNQLRYDSFFYKNFIVHQSRYSLLLMA